MAVDFVGAIFFDSFPGVLQRKAGEFGHVGIPESPEILRQSGVGCDPLGREADFDMMLGGFAVDGGREPAIAESGAEHGPQPDGGPAVLQHDAARDIGGTQLVADFILHGRAVLRDAVAVELDFDGCFFARGVEPVGMVGTGDPQKIAAIRIVLGLQSAEQTGGEQAQ